MGNLTLGIKKFMQNKNTVTILGVVVAIAVLYFAYIARVQQATNPRQVPYAAVQIEAGTLITEDMIRYRDVPPSMLEGDVIYDSTEIVDKYANIDTAIPEGSLFYERAVVAKEQLPDNIIKEYPSGYVLYRLDVDVASTYGNSVLPGNFIDIWLKAVNKIDENEVLTPDADRIMYGKLISNIKVLAVLDEAGNPVFQNAETSGQPSMVIFALPEEYYVLLMKAGYMRTYDTSIELVPTNESLKPEPGDLELSSEQLKEWINNHTIWVEN